MPRRTLGTFQIPSAPWWSPHETVLARDTTEEDMAWVQDRIVQHTTEGKNVSVQVLSGKARQLLLVRNIVSWTFTDLDRHGNPQPVPMPPFAEDARTIATRLKSINGLAPEDSAYLYEQITKRSEPMTEAEEADFLTPAIDGSVENPVMPSHLHSLSER